MRGWPSRGIKGMETELKAPTRQGAARAEKNNAQKKANAAAPAANKAKRAKKKKAKP